MTELETECIDAMNQAYIAIYPCCQATKDCNETLINETAVHLGGFRSQLEAVGNITSLFNTTFWIIEAKIGVLDDNCGNLPASGITTESPFSISNTISEGTNAKTTEKDSAPTTAMENVTTEKTEKPTTSEGASTNVPEENTTVGGTTYTCCPEYQDNHDCQALCELNNQVSDLEAQIAAILAALNGKKLRMRQARSAIDLDLEGSLLDALKEAFVLTENCVDFNICNGTHAVQTSRELRNIGEFFITNGLTNLSESFSENILNLFRKIEETVQRNMENKTVLECPHWIQTLNLDDALLGSLCTIFSDSFSRESRYRRETRTDCTNEYIDVVEELLATTKNYLESKENDTAALKPKDIYIKIAQLHTCADLDHVNAAHAAKLNTLQELFRQLHN